MDKDVHNLNSFTKLNCFGFNSLVTAQYDQTLYLYFPIHRPLCFVIVFLLTLVLYGITYCLILLDQLVYVSLFNAVVNSQEFNL